MRVIVKKSIVHHITYKYVFIIKNYTIIILKFVFHKLAFYGESGISFDCRNATTTTFTKKINSKSTTLKTQPNINKVLLKNLNHTARLRYVQ